MLRPDVSKSTFSFSATATMLAAVAWLATSCVPGFVRQSVAADLQRDLAATRRELLAQRHAERELDARCSVQLTRLTAADSRVQELEAKVAALKDSLQKLRGEKGELSHECASLDQELVELRDRHRNLYPDYDSDGVRP